MKTRSWRRSFSCLVSAGALGAMACGSSSIADQDAQAGVPADAAGEDAAVEIVPDAAPLSDASPPAPVGSSTIFQDDFEGALASQWGSLTGVQQLALPGETGRSGNGFRFRFAGKALGEDSWAEARFDLGALYPSLTMEFDLWIPANYEHRNDSPTNNKFFRLWQEDYGDVEKIGSSFIRGADDTSTVGSDYRREPTWGISTAVNSAVGYIGVADRGTWMAVEIEVTAPTDVSDGILKFYKNGTLFLTDSEIPNHEAGTQGYRYGYLLGWANSGFTETTDIWMDNVVFKEGVE